MNAPFRLAGDKSPTFLGHRPGQLSGVVFAAANFRRQSELQSDRASAENDGILTADEIAFLRLEGCDLMVLSACETNVGAVAGGEGILGLQRDFQQAGARSVVSSLWKVDDAATQSLMQLFYTNLWEKKLNKLDALRDAQLFMLAHFNPQTKQFDRGETISLSKAKVIDARPNNASSGSAGTSARLNPKYWAAFQLSGDWR